MPHREHTGYLDMTLNVTNDVQSKIKDKAIPRQAVRVPGG
jgi:hypothetical protein